MDLHVYNHSDREVIRLLKQLKTQNQYIIKQQSQMANEINAYLDRVETALTNIKQDIQDIKNGLPSSGGLTAAETAQVKARLSAVVKSAEDLDSENTRPEVPEEPEAPTG